MGGGELLTRHRRHHAPDVVHQPDVAPAPGKRTGVPLVDQGPFCKRYPEKAGCFLEADSRQYLIQSLGFVVQTAMTNFQTALQNQRVRLLTTVQRSSSSWGFIAEFLFQSLSGGLIGMLTKSLGSIHKRALDLVSGENEGGSLVVGGINLTDQAPRIAKLNLKHVTGAVVQISKGIRTSLKNAAHSGPTGDSVASAENVDKADFLKIIQDGIGPMANSLFTEAPASMTDGELAAMVAAYSDMTYHSIAAYEADVVALLDIYDKEQVASVGDGLCNGTDERGKRQMLSVRHAVWVHAGKRSRLAIIETFDRIYAKTSPWKQYDGKAVKWEQSQFVSWVSDELLEVAQDYEAERNAACAPLDATKADTGMKEVDAWAKEEP